jgi:hypothetical protein
MGKKLAELEEDRDAGKPGARERLKSFRAERILLVDSIVQVSYMPTSTPLRAGLVCHIELRRI